MEATATATTTGANTMTTNLTPESFALFMEFAKDAGNWDGCPLLDLDGRPDAKGNLTDLKRKKLLGTRRSDGCDWIHFTPAGEELAAANGIIIETY